MKTRIKKPAEDHPWRAFKYPPKEVDKYTPPKPWQGYDKCLVADKYVNGRKNEIRH